MIDRRGPRPRVQAACLLPLLLALAGCGNSLEQRIGTLHSGGYDAQHHEPDAYVEEGEERPRMRPRSRSSRTGDTPAHRRQTTEIDSVASRIARWKPVPADHKRTPNQHSPEWVREQAEAAEKDRTLDRKIRSICRGC
jgi:hypothetical protein